MEDEYESIRRRLLVNLEDNTDLLINISKELKFSIEWDLRDKPEILQDRILYPDQNMVDAYGSQRTKYLFEVYQILDNMRKPFCDAISLLRRADKLKD